MKTGKFAKNLLAALTLMTAAYPLASSAKTTIVPHYKPSPQEITAILNKSFRAIENEEAGPMRFSLSKSPQNGLMEVLYAPPAWYKSVWDQDKIYRIGTPFDEIKDITVSGDYIVVSGNLKGSAVSQISVFFKTRKYPMKKNVMVRRGPPPTAKVPTILDVVIEGCTTLSGTFEPQVFILYGQDKNGAFDLALMGGPRDRYDAGSNLTVRPNGELDLRFDSGVSRIIGKVELSQIPAKNTCGRLVVELANKVSLDYSKSTRPMLEGGMFFPFPVIAVKHDVRFGFEGQEIRCQMLSSRDEVVGYEVKGARNCGSNPES